ncbi:hypothetical protein H0H93_005863 [Arthromyces matolae]|nr:hypothetical protein H0H93_005863 [Arthromyces matolae]
MKRLRVMRDIVDTWDRTATEIFNDKKRVLQEGDETLAKPVGQAKDLITTLSKLLRSSLYPNRTIVS